ncbi:MAG TPA: hypothetical protein VFQ44_08855 [Streptosporangiaceae bacterium]|nr:hypothetical protein [Streptosporangiaceae bacterium]
MDPDGAGGGDRDLRVPVDQIHRIMQATAVVVGASLVIMPIQGLRYGSLPAHEMSLARPPGACSWRGRRCW